MYIIIKVVIQSHKVVPNVSPTENFADSVFILLLSAVINFTRHAVLLSALHCISCDLASQHSHIDYIEMKPSTALWQ